MYDAAASECFSFVFAINMSQKTDHHSKRKPPGASIAEVNVSTKTTLIMNVMVQRILCQIQNILNLFSSTKLHIFLPTGSEQTFPSARKAFAEACNFLFIK
jgi:hypothetical protein